mgnify:CR=1 FL=1
MRDESTNLERDSPYCSYSKALHTSLLFGIWLYFSRVKNALNFSFLSDNCVTLDSVVEIFWNTSTFLPPLPLNLGSCLSMRSIRNEKRKEELCVPCYFSFVCWLDGDFLQRLLLLKGIKTKKTNIWPRPRLVFDEPLLRGEFEFNGWCITWKLTCQWANMSRSSEQASIYNLSQFSYGSRQFDLASI